MTLNINIEDSLIDVARFSTGEFRGAGDKVVCGNRVSEDGARESYYDCRDVDNDDPTPSDRVSSYSPPTSISRGDSYSVTILYKASTERLLQLSLMNKDNNFVTRGYASAIVPAGEDTVTLTVMVDEDALQGSNFVWNAYITPLESDWNDRFNSVQVSDITVR